MKCHYAFGGIVLFAVASFSMAAGLGEQWIKIGDGDWQSAYEFRPIIKQANQNATGQLISRAVQGGHGAWRGLVEPAPHAQAAGIVVLADDQGRGGLQCVLGGTGESRGFALRGPDGKTLWSDAWTPWTSYQPYLLEAVVEHGRVRVQMFHWDGATLLSQSDWIEVDAKLTDRPGHIGLMTETGIGRFWGWQIASEPLSPITPDAPNKLRIVQGPESSWIAKGGMWQWADAARQRIRQSTSEERAWAFQKEIRGRHRRWSTHVKVDPGAGGAGLVFQGDGTGEKGMLCWLGGKYGAGGLMLYDLSKKWSTPWSSPQDKWHYNEALVLVGESRPGQARVQLLKADGQTVIVESPWVDFPAADQAGMIGFHTWKGSAEFWGFDAPADGVATNKRQTVELGKGWTGSATNWRWEDAQKTTLVHAGKAQSAVINRQISGIFGSWQCRVTPHAGSTGALLFHVSADAKVGFAAVLTVNGGQAVPSLVDLEGRTLWSGRPIKHQAGDVYEIDAMSTTDRVQLRVRSKGGNVLAQSDQIYVSDAHNTRVGHLGLQSTGKVTFSSWSFKKE